MWGIAVADVPLVLGTIASLVFLEGLLSADNALVLAVMVRHLPRHEQRRALRYGIWGAFVFRLIAIVLSSKLLQFWQFQVVGGLYLLYLAGSHFLAKQSKSGDDGDTVTERLARSFWATVVSVELADIAFSIDSIVAAVAMAPSKFGPFWRLAVVYLGGILGIVAMRFVAGGFVILLEKFHGLTTGAYVLVAWIGVKLIASGLKNAQFIPSELPEPVFWSVMLLIVVASVMYRGRPAPKKDEALVEVGKSESVPGDANKAG
ncbi:MAG: TerC family protein [Isosphaeraceae bacterium]|nr:TerC family protein [Isosphaeraceae bacterium]